MREAYIRTSDVFLVGTPIFTSLNVKHNYATWLFHWMHFNFIFLFSGDSFNLLIKHSPQTILYHYERQSVYDITSQSSFAEARIMPEWIQRVRGIDVAPMVCFIPANGSTSFNNDL